MSQPLVGIVMFFNNVKGWGLIRAKQDGIDTTFFAHWRNINCPTFKRAGKADMFKTLKAGSLVTFLPGAKEADKQFMTAICIYTQSITDIDQANKILGQVTKPQEEVVYGCN